MKNRVKVIFLLMITILPACKNQKNCADLFQRLNDEFSSGNFKKLELLADSINKSCSDSYLKWEADSLLQIADRIELDFSSSVDKINKQIRDRFGEISPEEIRSWEEKNWLEYKIINGQKRYFNRAFSNLLLLRDFYLNRAIRDSAEASDPEIIHRKEHTSRIIREVKRSPVLPVKLKVSYKITVSPGTVPAGQTVRCWLPYPKENHERQHSVTLISTSNPDYIISPDTTVHRTIYMEGKAMNDKPLLFSVSYSYISSGQYFDPDLIKPQPYNKQTDLYLKYTSEEPPHICFTERVKKIADSIAGNESNPFVILRKFYYWFAENIPWSGALEYSTIPVIPEYVLVNGRGDCGMQTFLLMSMLRYKGIPVRWQSGWKLPPNAKNLHDWCEVFIEGTGWIPVDISYGLQYSDNIKLREFYISGIDSYRLIVNDGVSGTLIPSKKFLRSEPYDFQRGEVEWAGGNLYFDQWDYEMKIEYDAD